MIPLTLTLEGIYSYQKAVTIDFRRLTAAQLFGIFGPVGSGKSTILEAMTLALYGESARLSRADNRSSNMLNLRSDRLAVDFSFLDHASRPHRFTVEAKRNSKRPEEVGSLARRAYRFEDSAGEWIPLDHTDGELVLGLSYANFRRTTIIPQGRFQEFLQLGPKDRTEMMKELFQLERFDLFGRARALQSETTNRLTSIESALGELPAEAESLRADLTAQRTERLARRDEVAAARTAAEARRDGLEERTALYVELDALTQERTRLEREASERARREDQVSALRMVRDTILAPWEQRADATRRANEAAVRLDEVEKERAVAAKRGEDLRAAEGELAVRIGRRPVIEALSEALEVTISRRPLTAELENLRRSYDQRTARRADLTEEIERRRRSVAELREGLPEQQTLGNLAAAVDREERAAEARHGIAARREAAYAAAEITDGTPDSVERERERVEREIRDAEAAQRRATIRDHVAGLAGSLAEGEPCPVCGSIHHPGAPTSELPIDDIPEGGDLTRLNARLHALIQLEATLYSLAAEERAFADETTLTAEGHAPSDGTGAALAPGDPVRAAIPADTVAAREWISGAWKRHAEAEQLARRIEDLGLSIASLDREIAVDTARIEERGRTVQELDAQEAAAVALLDEKALRAFQEVSATDRADRLREEVRAELARLDADQSSISERVAAARREEDRLAALEEERRGAHERAAKECVEAGLGLEAALRTVPFDEEAVPALLADLPTLPRYEEEIRSARDTVHETDQRIAAAREKLVAGGGVLPESVSLEASLHAAREELDSVRREITTYEAESVSLTERIGALGSQLETINAQIGRRDELLNQQSALLIRRENLTTMLNLFRGAGFVGYVAQVYLEQLIVAANQRFRRLTRNQLELALSGDRDISVIDYLNGGRRRSVKTLSGGQTFQAALCLALALVDSIDRSTSGDQPAFFFLDEGFGSLDGESLREVFETLKNLRRENRIIGVISHVEALQQEIDTHLTINLDEDLGSQIRTV